TRVNDSNSELPEATLTAEQSAAFGSIDKINLDLNSLRNIKTYSWLNGARSGDVNIDGQLTIITVTPDKKIIDVKGNDITEQFSAATGAKIIFAFFPERT